MNLSNFNSICNKLFAILFLIFAIVYGISPVDLVPDTIPIIGWLDDLFLNLASITNAYFQWRKRIC